MAGPSSGEIAQRQDLEVNLRRQLAARRYYSLAKRSRLIGQSVALLLALSSPIIFVIAPDLGPKLGAAAGLWIFISRLLIARFQRRFMCSGAAAQELFDCDVLGLPWNDRLARRPGQEDIRRTSERNLKEIDRIKGWYPCPPATQWPLSVLICQRSNTAWARRQHYWYGLLLSAAAFIWVLFGIVFAVAQSASLVEYLTIIALPSLPALLDWTEIATSHFGASEGRGDLEEEIGTLIRHGNGTDEDLREIQDGLFKYRCYGPLVPDWFYRRLRAAFEKDMRGAAEDYASTSL